MAVAQSSQFPPNSGFCAAAYHVEAVSHDVSVVSLLFVVKSPIDSFSDFAKSGFVGLVVEDKECGGYCSVSGRL